MANVLFITNTIPHYRLPLYNLVGEKHQLTIAHAGTLTGSNQFKEIQLREYRKGPFLRFRGDLPLNDFEVVIIYLNVRLLNLYKIVFNPNRKYKCILFGIGVSASYTKKYDSDKWVAGLTRLLIKRSDAAIFYDNYPVVKYSAKGVLPDKMFVAHNTVVGNTGPISSPESRNSFLFLGSLYKQKGIGQLLVAYQNGLASGLDLPVLNIIGDGPDRSFVEKWVAENYFEEKIKILGQINEESELKRYFEKALCCISPGQAGLSVQKSFSYGVPFLTSYYPISGGEFTSIIEDVTGFFYDGTDEGLLKRLTEVIKHPYLAQISENCFAFYAKFRSPEIWAKGFYRAIDYVLK